MPPEGAVCTWVKAPVWALMEKLMSGSEITTVPLAVVYSRFFSKREETVRNLLSGWIWWGWLAWLALYEG
jgi:hypothetical protein